MVDQKAMNGRSHVRENLVGFAHDVTTLAELQLQLLGVDLREARATVVPALVAVAAGAMVALGCVPVLLIAIAQLLVELAGWPASGAYALAGGLCLLLAVAAVVWGIRKLVVASSLLQRSRTELLETMKWIKDSLAIARDTRSREPEPTVYW